MLLAERHLPTALDTKPLLPLAGGLSATPAKDVHHSVPSMFLALHRRLATLDSKARSLRAGVMCATLAMNVNHAVHSMLFAYTDVFLPSAAKLGLFGQMSLAHLPRMFTMPSSPCCLRYAAILLLYPRN